MNYAKLIDGELVFAPNPILHNGNWIGNPSGYVYEQEGYKPVVYADPPEVEPGYIAAESWTETSTEIMQTWTVAEEPDEVDDARAMEILFGEGSE